MNFGVERTRAILNALSSPDDKLKIIHISGTNGKGSTAEYISRILLSAGKKAGTFTSPAIFRPQDMFKINCEEVEEGLLEECLTEALSHAGGATPFEVYTAGALYAFYKAGCEYAVVECGLGGLLDATNAINKKELAVITSIGLEHTAILGNTVEEICRHKAGIIKNCPAVVNPLQCDAALNYFRRMGARIADGELKLLNYNGGFQNFLYRGESYKIPVFGYEQACNAATAIEAARLLKIDQNSIRIGISAAKLPARLQIIHSRGNTYILDGSHNPQSFSPLASLIKSLNIKPVLIFGCLSDKDIYGDLAALKGLISRAVAVPPPSPRAMDIDKIYSALKAEFTYVTKANGTAEALNSAFGTVVVCGSFTLMKEALNWIEKEQ